MSVKNSLDLKGIIRAYPVAEVMLELLQRGLSGSLRIEQGDCKAVVYFVDGAPVYAVSNQRIFRLAEILLSKEIIDKKFLAQNRQVTNDLQLADLVVDSSLISREEIDGIIGALCESVIAAAFTWSDGEWIFSPHSRLKAGLSYPIDLMRLLLEHARSKSAESVIKRFENPNEWFGARHSDDEIRLHPEEAFIMSRLDANNITLEQLISISGLERAKAISTIYSLWLGGFLSRYGWNQAFSDDRVDAIKSANLELKKQAKPVTANLPQPSPTRTAEPEEEETAELVEFDLEDVLKRIETAANYYQILGVEPAAKVAAIRKAYFGLAKMLHPDRYHNETKELLRRVEKAFTELAQAHETLKNSATRQSYDMRMHQAELDKERGVSETGGTRQEDRAAADFERGFALQLDGQFDAAVPYLARAVHYSPNNARYHAYYGKTLSADEDQRHKAQNELLKAVQLEPSNVVFRLLLAEFYVKYKLLKRAEGELNRLLEIAPDNREARKLLDSLQVKSLN